MNCYEAIFEVDDISDELYLFLEKKLPTGWQEDESTGEITIRAFFLSLKEAEDFKKNLFIKFHINSKIRDLPHQNWQNGWKKYFTPVKVKEKFLIIPPWEKGKTKNKSLQRIIIYPQMAFGTGHHPTTYMCLESLLFLMEKYKLSKSGLFLDIGTGSGILSFACFFMGLSGIGLDIDPQAIKNAKLNKKLNNIKNGLLFIQGDISCIKGKFQLILANIQAHFHISYAKHLTNLLDKKGWLVLSGMVLEQKDKVSDVYKRLGLKGPLIFSKEEWINLLWEKNA